MIPVDGIENFPLMGRAIFQKAAKRGDFFQKQVRFRSAWARLMAGRSKHVRYDIDGGDMLAYGLHSGSFPGRAVFFATLIMTEYPFKLKDAVRSEDAKRSSIISARPASLSEVEQTY
jgi:hypothetical protein